MLEHLKYGVFSFFSKKLSEFLANWSLEHWVNRKHLERMELHMNTLQVQKRLNSILAILAVIGALCEMAIDETTRLSSYIYGGNGHETRKRSPQKGH